MPKYLIRRRNRWGQWVHLDTWDYEPSDYELSSRFGAGEYAILIAEEGIIGLRKVKDVSIPWDIHYLEWIYGEPTMEYIRDKWGTGNYFVLKSCQPVPYQIFPEGQPHDVTWQNLQDGAGVLRTVSIIFRVEMPWV
jgi:hypothetical protein